MNLKKIFFSLITSASLLIAVLIPSFQSVDALADSMIYDGSVYFNYLPLSQISYNLPGFTVEGSDFSASGIFDLSALSDDLTDLHTPTIYDKFYSSIDGQESGSLHCESPRCYHYTLVNSTTTFNLLVRPFVHSSDAVLSFWEYIFPLNVSFKASPNDPELSGLGSCSAFFNAVQVSYFNNQGEILTATCSSSFSMANTSLSSSFFYECLSTALADVPDQAYICDISMRFNTRVTKSSVPFCRFDYQLIDRTHYMQALASVFDGSSQGYNSGFSDGYNVGSAEGYDSGYTAGRVDGYNSGVNNGYTDGRADGYAEGYHDGLVNGSTDDLNGSYDVGYKDGYDVGYAQGEDDGYFRGYQQGQDLYEDLKSSDFFVDSFWDLLEMPFIIISKYLNFNILGVEVGAFILSVISILFVGWLIRRLK